MPPVPGSLLCHVLGSRNTMNQMVFIQPKQGLHSIWIAYLVLFPIWRKWMAVISTNTWRAQSYLRGAPISTLIQRWVGLCSISLPFLLVSIKELGYISFHHGGIQFPATRHDNTSTSPTIVQFVETKMCNNNKKCSGLRRKIYIWQSLPQHQMP